MGQVLGKIEDASQVQFAERHNVSPRSVRLWIQKGKIPVLENGRIPVEAADQALKANGTYRKIAKRIDKSMSLTEAQRVLALEKAMMARQDRQKKGGQLLPADAVEKAFREAGRRVRDRLLSTSTRLGAVVMASPAKAERLIHQEMILICDELSGGLRIAD